MKKSMSRFKLFNGKIVTPYRIIQNGCVLVENGLIKAVEETDVKVEGFKEIDAKGNYISPGFIDIHTHGGGGHDFLDGTKTAYLGAAELHAAHGTTALVPTATSGTNEEFKKTLQAFEEAKKSNEKGAELLGLHMEGPYFSMEQRGAQDPKYIRNPEPEEYEEICSMSDDILRWSSAPELPGSFRFARYLTERGILPAIAHSNATYEIVLKAFESGYRLITHLYSGMSGVHRINAYRYAGVIESAYLIDEMPVEVIADGAHLPASLLKLIYKIKGPDKIALVTDSMRAAGMTEGESFLGSLEKGQKVIVEDGVAKLPDRTAFAGSVATTDRLVRTMINLADVPLTDAVKMMTATPAAIMGIEKRKGSILPGKDADLVIFNDNIDIKLTMVNGRVVYRSED
jgi:N-acetylglucosamine-6-phosphate deacetylase